MKTKESQGARLFSKLYILKELRKNFYKLIYFNFPNLNNVNAKNILRFSQKSLVFHNGYANVFIQFFDSVRQGTGKDSPHSLRKEWNQTQKGGL